MRHARIAPEDVVIPANLDYDIFYLTIISMATSQGYMVITTTTLFCFRKEKGNN